MSELVALLPKSRNNNSVHIPKQKITTMKESDWFCFSPRSANEENCIVHSTKDACKLLPKQFKALLPVFTKCEI